MIETVIAVVTWFVTRRMGQDMSPDVELNNLVSTRESAGFVCVVWLRVPFGPNGFRFGRDRLLRPTLGRKISYVLIVSF